MHKQINYLLRHDLDTSYMFQIRGKSANHFWTTEYPLYTMDTLEARPYQVRFFNNSGKPIYNWSICYGYINEHLVNLNTDSISNNQMSKKLDLYKLSAFTNDPQKFSSIMDNDFDVCIVSFWAMYFGKPMIHTLRSIENFIDTSQLKVVHVKCNLGRWTDE